MDPDPISGVLRRKGKFGHRHIREKGHVKTGAEVRMMQLQVKQPKMATSNKERFLP